MNEGRIILDRTELALLIAEGLGVDEIAEKLEVSTGTVYRNITWHGLKTPRGVRGHRTANDPIHNCPACGVRTTGRKKLCLACREKAKQYLIRVELLRHLGNRCVVCGFESDDPAAFTFLDEHGRPLPNYKQGNTPLATRIRLLEGGSTVCHNCRRIKTQGRGDPKLARALEHYEPPKKEVRP